MSTKLGLVGAGLIGRQHIDAIQMVPDVDLVSVYDPKPDLALDVPWAADYARVLADCDGVILAVPNDLHAPLALQALEAGVPVLVEKPLAASVADGQAMVSASEASGTPLLVGHHRRHNPLVQAAKAKVDAGDLGQITTVHGQCWLPKPDAYFETAWRKGPGAGPLFINLIHDVDLLMHLCGPVAQVHTVTSNAVRGAEVEETAVSLLQFASGALGTMNLSYATVAPWSWEITAGENPAYPKTDESCYWIGGTKGSLALPGMTLWHQSDGPDWWAPMHATRSPAPTHNVLAAQIRHFAEVTKGQAQPLVTGADGLRALAVIEAMQASAKSGAPVSI